MKARISMLFGAFLLVAVPAIGQKADVDKVDSILDRLEKRLLDHESDALTYGERTAPVKAEAGAPPSASYSYDKASITGSTKEQEELRQIANLVAELETQVDQLASRVQKTKQSLLDEAAIDNFIVVEAELAQTDQAALKSISVKLDGYPIYELNDSSGLWLPAKILPLYSGPLQPGSHRIDLEARLVLKRKDSLPFNDDMFRLISKSFTLVIPGGTVNNRYVVTITPPKALDKAAEATLKEVL